MNHESEAPVARHEPSTWMRAAVAEMATTLHDPLDRLSVESEPLPGAVPMWLAGGRGPATCERCGDKIPAGALVIRTSVDIHLVGFYLPAHVTLCRECAEAEFGPEPVAQAEALAPRPSPPPRRRWPWSRRRTTQPTTKE